MAKLRCSQKEEKALIADMHTHSENSHDSVCKIEEMLLAQRGKGTEIFAVTDHFDCYSFDEYDILNPIRNSCETVKALNEKYGGKPLVLAGVEVGEGIFCPEIYNRVWELAKYDVVIGSVHLVMYKDLTSPCANIDFSKLSRDTVEEYVHTYFDTVLTMIDKVEFDILAHLTLPLRYINGKYNIGVSLSVYEEKIEKILSKIIEKGIALEVNTSTLETLKSTMPPKDVLKKYYDMGGRLITLGSDAHFAKNASFHFEDTLETLGEIGFKGIYYYKERKPYQLTFWKG